MSHSKKTLTWYQLYLRIGKMPLERAKTEHAEITAGEGTLPVHIEYTESGNVARLALPEGYSVVPPPPGEGKTPKGAPEESRPRGK